ncbi:hypothetical protein GP486_004259 [Trichoglossum hirsutum]|uniref:Uncharacterized protein n=1 Tax=Trichoglossum hirsutum TaxID=265104 RepID=A0A9P8RPD5_9PEZI|nr:hypothetical protein GP486_004259 [Trichoglossum hirsutum]
MSEQRSGEHSPVDTLSSMVNLVLVQAGKVFRDPTRRSVGNLVHTRSQVGVMVPAALDTFHAALDELEIEIVSVFYIPPILYSMALRTHCAKLRAKEVFTRDLAVSHARRARREREAADAAAAEKDRIAAEEASARAAENMETEKLDISMSGVGEADVIMADELAGLHSAGPGGSAPKEGSEVVANETNEWSAGQSKPPKPPPLDLSEVTVSDTKPAGGESDALTTTAEATMHPESAHPNETPSTAGYKIMDFESMFNDPSGDPGTEDMNFDLHSFGGDGGDQDFLGSHSLGDGGVSTDISGTQPVTAGSVDVSALLPGLETYANAEDDASMFGNPPADSTTLPPAITTTVTSASQASIPLSGEPTDLLGAESSFDDIFLASMDDLGAGDGTGDDGDGDFASKFDDIFS